MSDDRPMILAEGLSKRFGDIVALDGIDLAVPRGTVLGLLGPNGAGKTTAVRILTTLLSPDAGHGEVAGYDVVADSVALRGVIGLAGQFAAVDENLTGRENLVLVGRLYHLGRAAASQRAGELLDRFDLEHAADRTVKTYSGGMRRRLDLAASLVARPAVLFLDEPTTGLDPRSRLDLWAVIDDLVSDGTTLLLTTQYLEEADHLADAIAVIDHGRVIAEGTSDELKSRVGGTVLELSVDSAAALPVAAEALAPLGSGAANLDEAERRVSIAAGDGASVLPDAVRLLDAAGVAIGDIGLRRPTLDDVFLALTGRSTGSGEEDDGEEGDGRPGRRRGRGRRRSSRAGTAA